MEWCHLLCELAVARAGDVPTRRKLLCGTKPLVIPETEEMDNQPSWNKYSSMCLLLSVCLSCGGCFLSRTFCNTDSNS